MDRRTARKLATVALSAGVVAALTVPSGAAADSGTSGFDGATPEMLAAVERDLGLSASEAVDQLAGDIDAANTEESLSESLGDSFAGAWIDDDQLTVAITDAADAADVRAAGAEPQLVAHSETALDAAMGDLDGAATPSAAEIHGWHVDAATNSVVVEAAPGAADEAAAWVEASGVDESAVRVETSTAEPRLFYDVVGGQAYYPGNSRCSIGFSVVGGFVTAGHCGSAGTSVRGYNQAAMGSVAASRFPGNDYAFVRVNSNWVPTPRVSNYSGGYYVVNSSQVASIGATVCRSGSTTGMHCGTIQARNQTVNYPQGTVRGLTRTTVCAEPGDSGGSFIASGISAQGVTSGGSGNCSFGGTTYFQPVNPILSAYSLTLVTG